MHDMHVINKILAIKLQNILESDQVESDMMLFIDVGKNKER